MIQFVNAGFSQVLPLEFVEPCQYVARGIRTGPAVNDLDDWVRRLVQDTKRHFDDAIFIVGGWDWRREDGSIYQDRKAVLNDRKDHLANQCAQIVHDWREADGDESRLWIDFGNELDLTPPWKNDLDGFFRTAMASYQAVRGMSDTVNFITGSASNFNRQPGGICRSPRGLKILKELSKFDWPSDTFQGLHPYRTQSWQSTWPTWGGTDEALLALRDVLKGRRLAITEMGWPSGGKFSDSEIAAMSRAEIEMWRDEFGAACYCHYQIQDSTRPDNIGEGGFGAHTAFADGLKRKPVAVVLHNQRNL